MEVWSRSSGFLSFFFFFVPFRRQRKPMRWFVGHGWLTDPTFPDLPSAHRKQIMSGISRTARGTTPENLPLQWFSEASKKKKALRKSKKLPKTGQNKTEDHGRIALLGC